MDKRQTTNNLHYDAIDTNKLRMWGKGSSLNITNISGVSNVTKKTQVVLSPFSLDEAGYTPANEHTPWKMMVGEWLSFGMASFQGLC